MQFRAFPDQNRSVHKFCRLKELITVEQVHDYFNGQKKEESWLAKANWTGVVNFYCMQKSLMMSMRFIFGDEWNDVPCSHHKLKLRPLNLSVIIQAYSLQKQLQVSLVDANIASSFLI